MSRMCSGSRKTSALTLAIALTTLVLYLGRAHFGLYYLGDEGYILALARRVQLGEIPHYDFPTLYPPTMYYLIAWLFDLFGPSILWPRYLIGATKATIVVLTYLISNRILPYPWAVGPPSLLLAIDLLVWGGNPMPHAGLLAEAWILVAWLALTRSLDESKARFAWIAGGACAVAVAFKQPPGLLGTIALWLSLITLAPARYNTSRGSLSLCPLKVASYAGGLGAVAILLHKNLNGITIGGFFVPAAISVLLLAIQGRPNSKLSFRLIIAFAAGWLIVGILGFIVMGQLYGLRGTMDVLFLQPMEIGSRRFTPEAMLALFAASYPIQILYWVSFSLAAGAILGARWRQNGQPASAQSSSINIPVVLAGFLLATLYSSAHPIGVEWIGAPFMVLLTWVAYQFWKSNGSLRSNRKLQQLLKGILTGILIAAIILSVVRSEFVIRWSKTLGSPVLQVASGQVISTESLMVRMPLARAPVYARREVAEAILETVQFIETHAEPGEPLFVFPLGSLFYFLTDRPNPTGFYGVYKILAVAEEDARVAAQMEKAGVRWVIWPGGGETRGTDPQPLRDFIRRKYQMVAQKGDIQIYYRAGQAQ